MIGFESEETMLRKLGDELRKTLEVELIAFAKYTRSLAGRIR